MAYGLENVDVTGLIVDAKACMRRHGVVIKGWRQRTAGSPPTLSGRNTWSIELWHDTSTGTP